MTGTEFQPQAFLPQRLPNIVRERETRRIAVMERRAEGVLLRVEDVFGHEQYGIAANRLLAGERGYDSKRVFIGGLELGAIFGVNLKLSEFLAHCSLCLDPLLQPRRNNGRQAGTGQGDGLADRSGILPRPLDQLARIVSRLDAAALRVLLYAHHAQDTQARSEAEFDVMLDLSGFERHPMQVHEYRFDKDHDSYFRLARALRDHTMPPRYSGAEVEQVQRLAACHPTRTAAAEVDSNGRLGWTLRLAGNGLNFVVIEPVASRAGATEVRSEHILTPAP